MNVQVRMKAEKKPLKPLNTERRYDNWKSAMSNKRAMGVGNFEQYKMQREVNFPILFSFKTLQKVSHSRIERAAHT